MLGPSLFVHPLLQSKLQLLPILTSLLCESRICYSFVQYKLIGALDPSYLKHIWTPSINT